MKPPRHFFPVLCALALGLGLVAPASAQNTTIARTITAGQARDILLNHKGQDLSRDTDGDGLSDALENQLGTNPNSVDSDGDGVPDGVEVIYGSNPLVKNAALDVVYLATKLANPTGHLGSEITDISNGDFAAGYAYRTNLPNSAVRWNLSTGTAEVASGTQHAFVEAVNASGVVVGRYGFQGGFRWLPGQSLQVIGVSQTFSAWDVNSPGDVVGEAYKTAPAETGAFVLKAGSTTISHLPTLPGYNIARAMGINDKNQVGGMVYNSSAFTVASVVWNNGTPTLLEVLGSNNRGTNFVYGISENGTVIGIKDRKARIWPPSGGTQVLPTTPTGVSSYPWKMTRTGEIIGEMNGNSVIWRPNGQGGWTIIDINSNILDADIDIRAGFYAYSMNDQGQIAGSYYSLEDFENHPVILTPMLRPSLAVDANRDGTIKLASADASDATTADRPYRFWLNDDIDREHTVDDTDSEEDDLGPNDRDGENNVFQVDWLDGLIFYKRDLEDFSRLHLRVGGLGATLASGQIQLGLKFQDVSLGDPEIQLYRAVEVDGGSRYLIDKEIATQQITGSFGRALKNKDEQAAIVTKDRMFILPSGFWADISDTNPQKHLLFEACKAGKGQLKLVILDQNGVEISQGAGVWMELDGIEKFYERWTVGDSNGGAPWASASRKKVQLAASGDATGHSDGFAYGANATEENKYILFVHGWNMQPWEKNRFAETAFKRLYWQGYKGRFGVFCWPTTYGFEPPYSAIRDNTNYDRGEWSAWRAATPLKNLLVNLHGAYGSQVYVMAHSMGNVVTGEALQLASLGNAGVLVNTYVASQAALPAHVYDGDRPNDLEPVFTAITGIGRAFDGSSFPQTPNIYRGWLATNGGAVSTRVNFYNESDYALWHDVWELNQFFKPDQPDAPDQPYTYRFFGNAETGDPDNFAKLDGVVMSLLTLGDRFNVRDRYEIMAFAAEARTKAVGATAGPLTLNDSVDLQLIWPADDQSVKLHADTDHPSGLNYSAHKWHSAQFRSTNMRQKSYWQTLLGARGFNLITTP